MRRLGIKACSLNHLNAMDTFQLVMCQAWLGPKASGFGLAHLGSGLCFVEARPEACRKPKPRPGSGLSLGSLVWLNLLQKEMFRCYHSPLYLVYSSYIDYPARTRL